MDAGEGTPRDVQTTAQASTVLQKLPWRTGHAAASRYHGAAADSQTSAATLGSFPTENTKHTLRSGSRLKDPPSRDKVDRNTRHKHYVSKQALTLKKNLNYLGIVPVFPFPSVLHLSPLPHCRHTDLLRAYRSSIFLH